MIMRMAAANITEMFNIQHCSKYFLPVTSFLPDEDPTRIPKHGRVSNLPKGMQKGSAQALMQT